VKQAYTQQFEINGKRITSVVMDEEEFIQMCDQLSGIFNVLPPAERVEDGQIAKLKKAKHIPMMCRGTKTQQFFDRYQIQTDLACFIVRGQGHFVLTQILESTDPELN